MKQSLQERLLTLTQFIQNNPENCRGYFDRGKIYSELEFYKEAIVDFTTTLSYKPDYVEAYYRRALVHIGSGDLAKGLNDLEFAINLNHEVSEHFVQDVTRGIFDRNPNDYVSYIWRAIAFTINLEYKRALEDLTKSIALHRDNPEAFFCRGVVYDYIDEFDKSLSDFNEAIKLNPNSFAAYLEKGKLLLMQGTR
ncbi:MAG: tetratricopeptide repeat protein [Candidatus Dojkabacteria bacterium]